MKLTDIKIKGKFVQGLELPLGNATLILIKARKGYIACGYWNLAAAEKFGDAAGIVRGVKNLDEALASPIAELTTKARQLGVQEGMTCRQALEKLI